MAPPSAPYEYPRPIDTYSEFETVVEPQGWLEAISAPASRTERTNMMRKQYVAKKDDISAADAVERMKTATRITESCDILTKDGVPLIRFRPGAMSLLWGKDAWESFHKQFLASFKDLVEHYPLNLPTDTRHPECKEEHERKADEWKMQGQTYGVMYVVILYMSVRRMANPCSHMAYWRSRGHDIDEPHVFSETYTPESRATTKDSNPVRHFLEATTLMTQSAAMCLQAWSPELYELYLAKYKEWFDSASNMRVLHTTNRACFLLQVLVAQLNVAPHRDRNDYQKGYVFSCPYGDWTGGDVYFPDLNVVFVQRPGDILQSASAVLSHTVSPVSTGQRVSWVGSSKNNMIEECQTLKTKECEYCGRFFDPKNYANHLFPFVDPKHLDKANQLASDGIHDQAAIRRNWKGKRNVWPDGETKPDGSVSKVDIPEPCGRKRKPTND